jgi:hypothetical protein
MEESVRREKIQSGRGVGVLKNKNSNGEISREIC